MDRALATKMTAELKGKTIGGWLILDYVNNGKSAVVFHAEKDGQQAALKVFDPEIVNRFGRDSQLARVGREVSLVGKEHPNLVRTLDGGADGEFLYIAMELFKGTNLAEALRKIPASEIRSIVAQIASAAKFLEELSFAHRDIKPENIGISPDFKTVKLLDLGVLKQLDLSSITDAGEQLFFIGTLQYSPPEFMYREETQSVEAWRAITFYQLGAVLHDLLTKKPLFADAAVLYTRLVRAIEREKPRIEGPGIDPDLRLLAQTCLLKPPQQRLDGVKWEDFAETKPATGDPLEGARRRIAKRSAAAAAQVREPAPRIVEMIRLQLYALRTSIHSAVVNTCKTETLPRYVAKTTTENPVILRTLFEPSGRQGLFQHLAVYCYGAVVDAATEMHELRLTACISPTRDLVPPEPDASAPAVIKKGPLIDQDIRSAIQEYVVLAYAEALERSAEGATTVKWLDIRRGA